MLGAPSPIGALAYCPLDPPPPNRTGALFEGVFLKSHFHDTFPSLGATYLAAVIGGSALVLGMAPAAEAAITAYSDKAAFEAALAPGAYTETQMYDSYPSYAGGSGFSYTVGASGGASRIGASDLMSSSSDPSNLVFNFGSGIKAFGGYLYNISFFGGICPR